jgi:hypothetical protein
MHIGSISAHAAHAPSALRVRACCLAQLHKAHKPPVCRLSLSFALAFWFLAHNAQRAVCKCLQIHCTNGHVQ